MLRDMPSLSCQPVAPAAVKVSVLELSQGWILSCPEIERTIKYQPSSMFRLMKIEILSTMRKDNLQLRPREYVPLLALRDMTMLGVHAFW